MLRRIASVLGLLVSLVGCATTSELRFKQAEKATVSPPGIEAEAPCELRLHIEQRPGPPRAFTVGSERLGAAIVERLPSLQGSVRHEYSDGVCVKREGKDLRLPSRILIASAPEIESRFCRDDAQPGAVLGSEKVDVEVCTWNGRFHAARPFTFVLRTAPSKRVDDLVEFVRVYRNGSLMAAWDRGSDQARASEVDISGESLRAKFIAATLPPHLAAMDFRIIPRGKGPLDVDVTVRNDKQRFQERVGRALRAGLETIDAELIDGARCFAEKVSSAASEIRRVVNGSVELPNFATECSLRLSSGAPATPLADTYASVDTKSAGDLQVARDTALKHLETLKEQALEALGAAKVEMLQDAAKRVVDQDPSLRATLERMTPGSSPSDVLYALANASILPPNVLAVAAQPGSDGEALVGAIKKLYEVLRYADQQIEEVRTTVEESAHLANAMYAEAMSIGQDTNKQAAIFNAIVKSLHEQEDMFEAHESNPPLLADEQRVEMEYGDKFQFFALAPWFGVPTKTDQQEVFDLSPAVAVPLLDLFGARLQWSRSRLADARVAIGAGYTQTSLSDDGDEKPAFLPHANISLANLKVGVGVAAFDFNDGIRILVGADLYKLLTGRNAEAL